MPDEVASGWCWLTNCPTLTTTRTLKRAHAKLDKVGSIKAGRNDMAVTMGPTAVGAQDLLAFNDAELMLDVAAKTAVLNLKRCNLGQVPEAVGTLKRMQVCDLR